MTGKYRKIPTEITVLTTNGDFYNLYFAVKTVNLHLPALTRLKLKMQRDRSHHGTLPRNREEYKEGGLMRFKMQAISEYPVC